MYLGPIYKLQKHVEAPLNVYMWKGWKHMLLDTPGVCELLNVLTSGIAYCCLMLLITEFWKIPGKVPAWATPRTVGNVSRHWKKNYWGMGRGSRKNLAEELYDTQILKLKAVQALTIMEPQLAGTNTIANIYSISMNTNNNAWWDWVGDIMPPGSTSVFLNT